MLEFIANDTELFKEWKESFVNNRRSALSRKTKQQKKLESKSQNTSTV